MHVHCISHHHSSRVSAWIIELRDKLLNYMASVPLPLTKWLVWLSGPRHFGHNVSDDAQISKSLNNTPAGLRISNEPAFSLPLKWLRTIDAPDGWLLVNHLRMNFHTNVYDDDRFFWLSLVSNLSTRDTAGWVGWNMEKCCLNLRILEYVLQSLKTIKYQKNIYNIGERKSRIENNGRLDIHRFPCCRFRWD